MPSSLMSTLASGDGDRMLLPPTITSRARSRRVVPTSTRRIHDAISPGCTTQRAGASPDGRRDCRRSVRAGGQAVADLVHVAQVFVAQDIGEAVAFGGQRRGRTSRTPASIMWRATVAIEDSSDDLGGDDVEVAFGNAVLRWRPSSLWPPRKLLVRRFQQVTSRHRVAARRRTQAEQVLPISRWWIGRGCGRVAEVLGEPCCSRRR